MSYCIFRVRHFLRDRKGNQMPRSSPTLPYPSPGIPVRGRFSNPYDTPSVLGRVYWQCGSFRGGSPSRVFCALCGTTNHASCNRSGFSSRGAVGIFQLFAFHNQHAFLSKNSHWKFAMRSKVSPRGEKCLMSLTRAGENWRLPRQSSLRFHVFGSTRA